MVDVNGKRAIVTGAGPVGWTVAEQLASAGWQVTVMTRSGSGPEVEGVTRLAGDASVPGVLEAAAAGGLDAVFHCMHGSAYDEGTWRRELFAAEARVLDVAAAHDAVVVFPESLYAYRDPTGPMTEQSPRDVTTGKRGVRTELLALRAASPAHTVSVLASDFYGPRVRMAHAGERMVPLVLDGKRVTVLGSADQPHSFTYVPDLAAAMVRAAERPDLWDRVLHAPTLPAVTQREMVQAYAEAAHLPAPPVSAIPGWVLKVAGAFHRPTGQLAEMTYQFARPFVLDSSASEELLGLAPTPWTDATTASVAWWQQEARGAVPRAVAAPTR